MFYHLVPLNFVQFCSLPTSQLLNIDHYSLLFNQNKECLLLSTNHWLLASLLITYWPLFLTVKMAGRVFTKMVTIILSSKWRSTAKIWLYRRILKGEVSLYHWPPVWLVWNQLYCNWQFLFLFAKQTNPNQSNRRSIVQWYFPFSIPWFNI